MTSTAMGTSNRRATPDRLKASTASTAKSAASAPSCSGADNRSFSDTLSILGIGIPNGRLNFRPRHF